jgi:hypothetical protein
VHSDARRSITQTCSSRLTEHDPILRNTVIMFGILKGHTDVKYSPKQHHHGEGLGLYFRERGEVHS